ncbi:MAG: hypothetical protein Q9200_001923 [Gallowayella weberi]
MDGETPKTPHVRRIIRSHARSRAAMERGQAAAKRSQNGHGRHHSIRQQTALSRSVPDQARILEPDVSSPQLASNNATFDNRVALASKKAGVRTNEGANRVMAFAQAIEATHVPIWIPASPPSTGYEAMRIRYDFDVLNLSSLTALPFGRVTSQPLQEKPSRLLDVMRFRQWSYFSYIPWRYGNTPCLDDAVCCVAARVRQWITNPGKPNARVLFLYSKALKSLQAALDDTSQRFEADVLCATEVLSIFELLDVNQIDPWVTHAAGAATLIQLRGPHRYNTNFEKALFLGQAGPIITETFFNLSPCFLEEPLWQDLFARATLGKSVFSTYSDSFVRAWASVSRVPGLFRRVREVLRNPHRDSTEVDTLLNQIVTLTRELTILSFNQIPISEILLERSYSLMHDRAALYLTNIARAERLIAALDHNTALAAEARAQKISTEIMDFAAAASTVDPRATLYLRFKVVVAKATIDTSEEWHREIISRTPETVMDVRVFDRWIGLSLHTEVANYFHPTCLPRSAYHNIAIRLRSPQSIPLVEALSDSTECLLQDGSGLSLVGLRDEDAIVVPDWMFGDRVPAWVLAM